MSSARRPTPPSMRGCFSIPVKNSSSNHPAKQQKAAVGTQLQENKPPAPPAEEAWPKESAFPEESMRQASVGSWAMQGEHAPHDFDFLRGDTQPVEWTQTRAPSRPASPSNMHDTSALQLVITPTLSPVLSTTTSAQKLDAVSTRPVSTSTSRTTSSTRTPKHLFSQRLTPPNVTAAAKKPKPEKIAKTCSQRSSLYGFGEPKTAAFYSFSLQRFPRAGAQQYTLFGSYQNTNVFFTVCKGVDKARQVRRVVPKHLQVLSVCPPLFYCEPASQDQTRDPLPVSVQTIINKYTSDAASQADAKIEHLRSLISVDVPEQEIVYVNGRVVGKVTGFADCLWGEESYLVQLASRCVVVIVAKSFAEEHYYNTPNAYFDCGLWFLRDVYVLETVVSVYRAVN